MTQEPSDPLQPPLETPTGPSIWPQMTGQAVSDYLGFSARWLSKLEAEGFLGRQASKLFDGGAVCRGYIAWLKDDNRRSSKTDAAKRKEAAQAEKIELEILQMKAQLVDIETVEATFAEITTLLRSELGAVPAGATRDLALRADIEKSLNDAFDRCGTRLDAALAALSSGETPVDGDEEGES